jgi:hypothetical protein
MKMMDFIDAYGTVGLAQIMPHGALLQTNANVFFVQNSIGSDSSGYGNSWEAPFATLDYAIGQCNGTTRDVILIDSSHTENIATAGAITADIANVSIVGLGAGSNRPTFTWTGTAATFAISAANVMVKNIRCLPGIDEVVTMFSITGANCTLDAVDHRNDNVGSYQTRQFVLTTSAADYLIIKNCNHIQSAAAGAAQLWISLVANDYVKILDNTFLLTLYNGATTCTINGDASVVNVDIGRNVIKQLGGTTQVSAILLANGATGYVHDNRIVAAVTTLAGINGVGNAAYAAENYCSKAVTKSGILDPVVDS